MKQKAGPQRLAPWHRQCALLQLAKPRIPREELAAHFGVSLNWIHIVLASDAYRHYLAELQAEQGRQVNQALSSGIANVTDTALQQLQNKVMAGGLAAGQLLDIAKTGLEAAGLTGNGRAPAVQVNNNTTTQVTQYRVDGDVLARAREAIAARQRANADRLVEHKETDYEHVTGSIKQPKAIEASREADDNSGR